MRLATILCFVAAIPFLGEIRSAHAQEARVELELIMEGGFPPENSLEWMRALERVGADGLRIRAAQTGDGIGVKNVGTERSPRYKVYGLLTSDNKLVFQGGTYRMTDVAGIRTYIDTLKEEGLEGLFAEKMAFGLNAQELVAVHEDLATVMRVSTQSKEVSEVLDQIERSLLTPMRIDRSAQDGFDEGEPIEEELRGMTTGTAMAAMLRPLGLVLVPVKNGRAVELVVMDSRDAEEHWPVGWPLEEAPLHVAPDLFESLPVEIRDFSLREALDRIQERVEIPFVYDQNSFARHGVDLDATKVEAQGRMTYLRVVTRLLSQSRPRLKAEVRVDEAGKPFLWITTVQQ